MRKALSIVLAAIMSLALLTGCGNTAASSSASVSSISSSGSSQSTGGSGKLVVYSALNDDDMVTLSQQFKKDTGIDIEYITLSGGDATARVQSEKDNPQADVVVGGSVDLYGSLKDAGALAAYDSPNNDDLDPMFTDTDHCWQGWYMGVQSIILNTDRFDKELATQGLERPKTWDDLLDSRYKNVLVWANPSTAGGAYIFTACQIFRLGEDKAWEYLKALDANVHHYYEAAGGVISPVATGEFIASIAWAHDSFKIKQQGYPLEIIIPQDTAFEIGGAAVIAGAKNEENAQKFIDWLLTPEIQKLNTSISYRYSVRDDVASPEGLPKLSDLSLVNYDRQKASDMKKDVQTKFESEIISKRAN